MSKNFPKNAAELISRLEVIKKGVPNQGNNIERFAIPAFKLFVDCGLDNHDVISELTMKSFCDRRFGCTMNPLGGVLRHQDLSMFDKNGQLRYYSQKETLYVTLEGVRYYVSNYWQFGCKKAFFEWLKAKATEACRKHWGLTPLEPPTPPVRPVRPTSANVEELLQTLLGKFEEMEKIDRGMCYLIPNLETQIKKLQTQADRMEQKIDKLVAQVDELHRELTN